MKGTSDLPAIGSDALLETASRWFARRRRGLSRREDEAFSAWLQADPLHRQSYEEVTRSWELAGSGAGDAEILAMRSEALMIQPERRQDGSRAWAALATAAALLLIVASAGGLEPSYVRGLIAPASNAQPLQLQTAFGQRSVTRLEDGSMITLNTNSRVKVTYSKNGRNVQLEQGQALFKVAKDAGRPFVVSAGDRQITALGTEFEVRLQDREVRVALLEGRVQVRKLAQDDRPASPRMAAAQPAMLVPGQQLVATPGGVTTVATDVDNLVSWRTGRVRFENTPLAEAVAEMNRYSRTRIELSDPSIADIRVSGSFRLGHSRSFAEVVAEAFPVDAEREGDVIRLTGA